MLQRQIMFKQMQELQRRQQMQELGDNGNQSYNASQISGSQFPPTINGTPVHDSSQMFMLGNMQMMQPGGSNAVQGLPNGFVLPQNQHPSMGPTLGFAQPQFGASLYGTPSANSKPSDLSLQSSPFGNSFMNQRGNITSDLQHGSFQSGQEFQEKNLFGQVPLQSFNTGNLSGSYSNRGHAVERNFLNDDSAWRGKRKELTFDLSQPDASLDPLEQKILYNTNESTVENTSSFMDEFPSMQGGSWSALMQSAVAETSSSDTGIQEEWSGLSFQNPEPSTENQRRPNFMDSERPQHNWSEMNLFNVSSSKPQPEQLFHSPNTSSIFPGFVQSSHQQKYETFHASSPHHSPRSMNQSSDHDYQQKHSIGRSQLIQTSSPSASMWPGQHNEHPKMPNNKDNKPHNYFPGDNVQSGNVIELFNRDVKSTDHTSGVQLNLQVSTPNESPRTESSSLTKSSNTPGFRFPLGLADDQTPQPYSIFPSLSMGNSSAASLPSRNINDYVRYQGQASPSLSGQMAARSSYDPATSLDNSQSKSVHSSGTEFRLLENASLSQPAANRNLGFSIASPTPRSSIRAQQELPFQKSNDIPHVFHPSDFHSSSPNAPSNHNSFRNERNVLELGKQALGFAEMGNSTILGSAHNKQESFTHHSESVVHQMPSRQTEQRRSESPVVSARDTGLFGHSSMQDQSMENLYRKAYAAKDKAKLNLDNERDKDWNLSRETKASSTAYQQNLQTANMFGQSDTQNHSLRSHEISDVTNQSQVSLQMTPSWSNVYGTVKDGQLLPISNPKVTINASQPFSGFTQADPMEKSLAMQVNLANTYEGTNVWPSTALPPTSKPVLGASMLPSNVSQQSTVTSMPKKRKMVVFEKLPWYKEINHEPSRLQNIGTAGLQWAEASNRNEEVKIEPERLEGVIAPAVRAKRRLVSTTELMQQMFRPPPAAVLRADSSDCSYVAHVTARLALGDACALTGHLPLDADEVSPEKVKTSNNTSASDFSKVAEVLSGRVKKLEDDLSRVDKSLSVVDIKGEIQDLEKFSTINRFAKYHLKTQQSAIDPVASSSVSRAFIQRYVIPHPMPQNVPEGNDCISL